MHLPRDPQATERAKTLRREMSPPERALWKLLRGHRLAGWKFTRQVPEGPYTIDFAARQMRLAIELDGLTHDLREAEDAARTAYLERAGWHVIRFTNADVLTNPEGVAARLLEILESLTPSPRPSPRGGEGE